MDLRRERKKQNRIIGMAVTVSAVFFAKPIASHDPASSGQLQGRASGLLLQAEVHP